MKTILSLGLFLYAATAMADDVPVCRVEINSPSDAKLYMAETIVKTGSVIQQQSLEDMLKLKDNLVKGGDCTEQSEALRNVCQIKLEKDSKNADEAHLYFGTNIIALSPDVGGLTKLKAMLLDYKACKAPTSSTASTTPAPSTGATPPASSSGASTLPLCHIEIDGHYDVVLTSGRDVKARGTMQDSRSYKGVVSLRDTLVSMGSCAKETDSALKLCRFDLVGNIAALYFGNASIAQSPTVDGLRDLKKYLADNKVCRDAATASYTASAPAASSAVTGGLTAL